MKLNAVRLVSLMLCLSILAPALNACAKPSELNRAISTLASGGVGVYADYASPTPIEAISGTPSAMRLTRWQLANMLKQADANMGMSGASIDAMELNAPKNAPTFSTFIAAWVQRGEGPLAQYAQEEMGKRDWHQAKHVIFSTLVLTLFIADAARMSSTGGKPAAASFVWQRLIAAPAQADGICSSVSNFISSVVSDVESALSIKAGSFFSRLWNVAVHLVAGLAEVIIGGILTPLLSILNAVAGGLAAITAISSTLSPWGVTIDANPTHVTVGEQQTSGDFTVNLDAKSIDWPAEVSDCSSVLTGFDLSKMNYTDAPVTWTPVQSFSSYATIIGKDTTIDKNKHATLHYQTIAQQPSTEKPGTCPMTLQPFAEGGMEAKVERIDVQHLEEVLAKLAFSKLPSFVRKNLMPLFKPQIANAESAFAKLVSHAPTGTGHVTFEQMRTPATCTPTPQPSPAPNTGFSANDMLGNWKCTFSTGEIDGVIYTTTRVIGTTDARVVVRDRTTTQIDKWTYTPTGPTTASIMMTSPTLIAKVKATEALLGRSIPLPAAYHIQLTWLSHDHLTESGSDGVHSATYDCTRM